MISTVVAQQLESVPPLPPGQPFPAESFNNVNARGDGPATIDLAQYSGKKPFILHYWIPGNRRSEQVLLELEALVAELSDSIALFGVAVPRPGLEVEKIRQRSHDLGLQVPVLEDNGFRIGQRLRVSSVPNISIIDRQGRLRLTNGGSLQQVLGYELDLAKAIRRTAATGKLMTHGYLDKYFPVHELEGEMSPDFKAPQLPDNVEQRWHSLIDSDKINVLIFWSVNCPHCRESLPEISDWVAEHPESINVVSCASVDNEMARAKTSEFCELNDFSFKTLFDKDSRIGDLYKITSTPTIVIVGPDGVVDSVILSGHADFGQTIEQKKRELLGASG